MMWRWLADRIVPASALHLEAPPWRLSERLLRRVLDNGALP